jgi:hypothetical protein
LFFASLHVDKKRPQAELCELSEIDLPIANNCMRWLGISIFNGLSQNVNRKTRQQLLENEWEYYAEPIAIAYRTTSNAKY